MPATWVPGVGRVRDGQLVNTPQEQANADAELAGASPAEKTLRDRIDQAVANLEQAFTNWDTLTPAQKDQAMKLSVRVNAGLGRLMLRKFDSAG